MVVLLCIIQSQLEFCRVQGDVFKFVFRMPVGSRASGCQCMPGDCMVLSSSNIMSHSIFLSSST